MGEIELRKDTTRTPTQLTCAEGNTDGKDDSASPCWSGVVEGPQARHRNFIHENREDLGDTCTESLQVGGRRLGAARPTCTSPRSHTTV